ncbi:MAG: hypothetical protein OEU80_00065 [Deltaproteobacteria bacterium]|nr:hypothetical protein [Deltaproteobacteria bacterium]MDH3773572.1 hypothetical protein [Deltaproteobacteria bacterium]MDH3800466.1 hypothetical protein [Deltaproteobacteria bacterium]MDH3897294.1 hypothetical protein [Deltaproteobacteria bacterium]MDH3926516.1 hypothetical protein [Deltaproteobacteria bacterium]
MKLEEWNNGRMEPGDFRFKIEELNTSRRCRMSGVNVEDSGVRCRVSGKKTKKLKRVGAKRKSRLKRSGSGKH